MDTIVTNTVDLLIAAIVVALIARRLALPYTVGLVIAGIILALSQTGVDVVLTHDFILDVILPPLLFEAAINIHWKDVRRDALPVLILAILGTLIAAAAVTVGMVFLLDWPPRAALLLGVLIAATDPVAVIAMFKDNRTEGRLRLLVESESLFNDGVAAVLFTLAVAGMQVAGTSTWFDAGKTLLLTAGGGIAIGLACAALAVLVVGRTIDHLVESTLTTVAAYGSFLLAERFHVSGVPSTVTAGLVVGSLAVLRDDERSRMTQRGREFVLALWPELTNWPSGTHKGTYPERPGGPPAEIRQTRVPAIDGPFGGDNGKQVISVRPPAPAKSGCFRPKKYTTNGVGMGHCTETRWERFSAHAGRLHARLHQR